MVKQLIKLNEKNIIFTFYKFSNNNVILMCKIIKNYNWDILALKIFTFVKVKIKKDRYVKNLWFLKVKAFINSQTILPTIISESHIDSGLYFYRSSDGRSPSTYIDNSSTPFVQCEDIKNIHEG